MNQAMLLSLLMQNAPRLLAALKSSPTGTFPNIENSLASSANPAELENQYANAYNHISSDLVPDSTNVNVALGNMDKALSIQDPMDGPSLPFVNGDMARQLNDDDMQQKVKLSTLYEILNNK